MHNDKSRIILLLSVLKFLFISLILIIPLSIWIAVQFNLELPLRLFVPLNKTAYFLTLSGLLATNCHWFICKLQNRKSKILWLNLVWIILILITHAITILADDAPKKPIIYLYPEKEQKVSIVVGYPERLSHTYPKYIDGWHVNALPNGTLTDLKTNRQLYALYWEGKHIAPFIPSTGFIVKGSDTISFLENKLAQLGLNEREAEEFIVYWLPQLESNPYNYIYFATLEEQNHNMPLLITPKPDTLIRVLMVWKPLTTEINIPQQVLPETPQRNGFTVVEWGGTKIGKGIIQ